MKQLWSKELMICQCDNSMTSSLAWMQIVLQLTILVACAAHVPKNNRSYKITAKMGQYSILSAWYRDVLPLCYYASTLWRYQPTSSAPVPMKQLVILSPPGSVWREPPGMYRGCLRIRVSSMAIHSCETAAWPFTLATQVEGCISQVWCDPDWNLLHRDLALLGRAKKIEGEALAPSHQDAGPQQSAQTWSCCCWLPAMNPTHCVSQGAVLSLIS